MPVVRTHPALIALSDPGLGPQAVRELRARLHAELAEHLAQVVLDRARADEQLRGDLPVGVSLAARREIWASCGVSWSRVSTVRLRARSPVASSSTRARSANASIPKSENSSWAVRSSLRASSVAVRVGATRRRGGARGRDRPRCAFGPAIDRLEVELLGALAFDQERLRTRRDAERPVCAARPRHLHETRERPRPARVFRLGRRPRSTRPGASWRERDPADVRRSAARPRGLPRSGRGRCTAPPRPSRAPRSRFLRRAASPRRDCDR